MKDKKSLRALLYPPAVVPAVLVLASAVLLPAALLYPGTVGPLAYAIYALATYALLLCCLRVPRLVKRFRRFRRTNPYARRWLDDAHLRLNASLYAAVLWNGGYALFQLALGAMHHSLWFTAFGMYYACLAAMRLFLLRYTKRRRPGDNMAAERKRYRACGAILLVMTLALLPITLLMVYGGRSFYHGAITTIAMAAYTFTGLTLAILRRLRPCPYRSPVHAASQLISLVAASVSMLTLESTMLTTFGGEEMDLFTQKCLLGGSGCLICLGVILLAVWMLRHSSPAQAYQNTEEETDDGRTT